MPEIIVIDRKLPIRCHLRWQRTGNFKRPWPIKSLEIQKRPDDKVCAGRLAAASFGATFRLLYWTGEGLPSR